MGAAIDHNSFQYHLDQDLLLCLLPFFQVMSHYQLARGFIASKLFILNLLMKDGVIKLRMSKNFYLR